jgi:hypothetical protein
MATLQSTRRSGSRWSVAARSGVWIAMRADAAVAAAMMRAARVRRPLSLAVSAELAKASVAMAIRATMLGAAALPDVPHVRADGQCHRPADQGDGRPLAAREG